MKSLFEEMGGTYTLGADGMYYPDLEPVSYTHLDVYKRQHRGRVNSDLLGRLTVSHITGIDVPIGAGLDLRLNERLRHSPGYEISRHSQRRNRHQHRKKYHPFSFWIPCFLFLQSDLHPFEVCFGTAPAFYN